MLLTKLEIKGFKSFADKVFIGFDSGVTGIVGPNGCGKSNIVDSIRWVLGEQKSSALRSEKMENIIFNGTKNRKPTQLAEVSLTFNNTRNLLPTEYSEVTITRRYYRSGESEYLLNGVPCRLKDITNLFLDTGISSNSYAIIELKMVDDLLNDKGNSRRQLFEESAGISKFKIRKKETLKKLSDTDMDLERVDDLLYEIEKNLKSLERQSRQAKKYYAIKEDYKNASIALANKSLSDFKNKLTEINESINNHSDKKLEISKKQKENDATIQKAKSDLILKEKYLSSRQQTLNEHVNRIRQYESENKIRNERLRFLNDKSDNLKQQIEQDRKSNDRAAFSLNSLQNELETAEKIYDEITQKVGSLKQHYEDQKQKTQKLTEEANLIKEQVNAQRDHNYQLNKSLEIKEMQLNSLNEQKDKIQIDSSMQSSSLETFKKKLDEIHIAKEEANRQLGKSIDKEKFLEETLNQTEKTIQLLKEDITKVNRKYDAIRNEYNLTRSLVENLEGFPEAIKFLKKHSDWAEEAPLLSDILTCPEDYRVTIENYLEPVMNYFVVETERQAYQAVNILSDSAKGKANFFVLENFENYKAEESKIFYDGIAAIDIIEFDNRYKNLLLFLLDKVYILDGNNLENYEVGKNIVLMAKSGKITKKINIISGGSVGLFEGKRIGRAKNLKKLEQRSEELINRKQQLEHRLKQTNEQLAQYQGQSQKNYIEALKKKASLLNEDYISIKAKQEQFQQQLDTNITRQEDIDQQIINLNTEISTLKPEAEAQKNQLQSIIDKNEAFQEELKGYNEILSQKSSAYNQENILYHQQQNKVNSIKQELSFKQSTYESSKTRIEKNQLELKNTDLKIKKLVENTAKDDDKLIEMYEEKETIEVSVNDAEKAYYESRGIIDKHEKDGRELQRSKEAQDNLIMEYQNKQNEIKLHINSLIDRIQVTFDLDLNAYESAESVDNKLTHAELEEKVTNIKQKLDNIGPINPMAMETYEEIKERHEFINSQKEDLVNAKSNLLTTIKEIDEVAKQNFLDSFEKINANFKKVFCSLFSEEDDCYLKLDNPEDPLESHIEIIAKPKGKRPLSINQLSGGEKTLTAISLLFAIYLLKPAPFCIFDEVDAPLDDMNIDKFNGIIRDFSDNSQFIIVTHNKRTMASTDIMYGITMNEPGVSTLVAVDLRELA